jgi:hypothetical protein
MGVSMEKYKFTEINKRIRQVKGKVKSILINFFDIKGTVHKEFVIVCQTDIFTYYCDILW